MLENITRYLQDSLTSLENGDRELQHNIDSVTNGMTEIGSKLSSKLSSISLIEIIIYQIILSVNPNH